MAGASGWRRATSLVCACCGDPRSGAEPVEVFSKEGVGVPSFMPHGGSWVLITSRVTKLATLKKKAWRYTSLHMVKHALCSESA